MSCLSLETSANLIMSRPIFPYLVRRVRCKIHHMRRSKCNRSFHSHKLAGVFGEKKKLCTCKPYNLESHYACIYGFNLFLTLCQPPVSVLVVDYPGRLYISMWLPARESFWGKISACENDSLLWRDEQMRCSHERCTGNVALTFTLTVGWNENIYKNIINVKRSLYIS